MTYKGKQLRSITIQDVSIYDYPDFSDAFIQEAWSDDLNRWLTEHEIDEIEDQDIQDYILKNLDLYL